MGSGLTTTSTQMKLLGHWRVTQPFRTSVFFALKMRFQLFFFLSHLASPLYRERRKNEVCFPHRVGLHKPEAGPIASSTADRSAPAQSFTVLSMAALCYNGRVEFLNMNYKA